MKKTVLLTGSTPMQVGSKKTQLKIITAAASWFVALKDMGYEVDWRAVTPGENVSAYTVAFVILNKPNSIASAYVHGAFWTLSQRPDAIVLVDDWQTDGLRSGIASVAKLEERLFRLFKLNGGSMPKNVSDSIFALVRSMNEKKWKWPVIAPILGKGNTKLLGLNADVIGIDPTAYTKRYSTANSDVPKDKRWVQASLLFKDSPRCQWPIMSYGWLDRGKGGVGRTKIGPNAQPRVAEPELMKVYQKYWGVLSPAHPHAGSGWWRVRFLMAADAGCILSAFIKEAACLGDPYLKASSINYVENLGNIGLQTLAQDQQRRLEEIVWPTERVKDVLSGIIKNQQGQK